MELWRRREHLSEVERVRPYLFRALRHQLGRNLHHDIFESAEDIDDFLDYLSVLSSEQHTIDRELRLSRVHVIQEALSHLSKRQREAVHLRFFQGFDLDEAAETMEIPKQVVKNLLSKSYAVLRVTLRAVLSLSVSLVVLQSSGAVVIWCIPANSKKFSVGWLRSAIFDPFQSRRVP